MKKFRYIIAGLLFLGIMSACNTLDIPPINVVQDKDLLTSASGIQAYMAALYSRLPIEDFKFNTHDNDGFNNQFDIWLPSNNTGENTSSETAGFTDAARGYWKNGYLVIRSANNLIENLPKYIGTLSQGDVTRWIAEAKFIRAYTYFALVKRYGGVPIIDKVQNLGNSSLDSLQIPRSSEQEVYDFILSDLDFAISNIPKTSEQSGRVNMNVAYAFKSRVALYAGSIARYGKPYVVDGIMLCGIPAVKANDYFKLSFSAAKAIEGAYSLYMKNWSATDKKATADNYANLFLDESSSETIFEKSYSYPDVAHDYDLVNSPIHMTSTYGGYFNPLLDYVELFDGLSHDSKGHLKTTDDLGNYIVYNYAEQPFENCEPRLRGTVLLPGQPFKYLYNDVRRGTIAESVDPSTPVQKFVAEDMTTSYASNAFFKANVREASIWSSQIPILLSTGQSINPIGLDCQGPTRGFSGFHGRKYLQPNLSAAATTYDMSTQSWIEIRYAEILLNRAEAALELFQNGVASSDGVNLQEDAYQCINMIRNRAGAILLPSSSDLSTNASIGVNQGVGGYVLAPNRGLQIIRIERRKELAFENQLWWDMRRWRTADLEINNRIFRVCCPFLFAKGAVPVTPDYVQGKYIYDCRFDERNPRYSFATKYYYEAIPGAELNANPKLKQNEQY